MAIADTLKELRGMHAEQLQAREEELRTELFKLRGSASTEKVKDTTKSQKLKKDIARIKTLQAQQSKKNTDSKAQA